MHRISTFENNFPYSVKHSKLPKATNSTTENTYITINTEKKDAIEMGGFSNAAVVELVRNT